MANKTIYRGFAPHTPNGESIPCLAYPKSTSSVLPLFMFSPGVVSGGQVLSVVSSATAPSGATVNGGMTGTILCLLNSDYSPTQNLAAAAAGWCVITTSRTQVFISRVSTAAYVDADAGKTFRITATETSSVATSTSYGDDYSGRGLDGAQEAAVGVEQITAGRRVLPPNVTNVNDAGVIGTDIYCSITNAFFFPAGA